MFCPYKEECRENGVEHGRIFSIVGIEAACQHKLVGSKNTSSSARSCTLTPMAYRMSFREHCIPPRAERRNSASPPLLLLPLPLASGMKYSSAAELTKPSRPSSRREPFIVDLQPRRRPLPTKTKSTPNQDEGHSQPKERMRTPNSSDSRTLPLQKPKPNPKKRRVASSILDLHPSSFPSLPPSLFIGHQHRVYMYKVVCTSTSIPKEKTAHLMMQFTQTHRHTKKNSNGTSTQSSDETRPWLCPLSSSSSSSSSLVQLGRNTYY